MQSHTVVELNTNQRETAQQWTSSRVTNFWDSVGTLPTIQNVYSLFCVCQHSLEKFRLFFFFLLLHFKKQCFCLAHKCKKQPAQTQKTTIITVLFLVVLLSYYMSRRQVNLRSVNFSVVAIFLQFFLFMSAYVTLSMNPSTQSCHRTQLSRAAFDTLITQTSFFYDDSEIYNNSIPLGSYFLIHIRTEKTPSPVNMAFRCLYAFIHGFTQQMSIYHHCNIYFQSFWTPLQFTCYKNEKTKKRLNNSFIHKQLQINTLML